jgi:predicted DNA-binding protein (UPF0278 family)
MNIRDIKQNFNQTELLAIKKFLKYVNDTRQTDSNFANDSSLDELNQFSAIAETDEQITQSVKDWLKKKKTFLRGNTTNN